MPSIQISDGTNWRTATSIQISDGTNWQPIKFGYISDGTTWQQFYSSSISSSYPSTISQSTNGTTYLTTLTGTYYSWTGPGPRALTYKFQKSTDNISWSDLTSYASLTEPASGSSGTKTYTLTQSDVVAGSTNYYRFTVHATYGSITGDSTSTSTSVYIPGQPTITVGTITSSSIAITWSQATVDFYATNRYIVWYYDPVSSSYKYAVNGGGGFGASTNGGSTTITGLAGGQTYTIFVMPVTGATGTTTSNYTGYNGPAAFTNQTTTTPVPASGTVSISTNTGNYSVGSVITYSTSGWTNSPYANGYYLQLHNGTNPVLTSDPLRASTSSSSGTYTITSSDVSNYFKAFATASNAGGTSTQAFSSQVGPATNAVVSAPATPTNFTISSSGLASWTPSAGATSYTLIIWLASSAAGANAFYSGTVTGITGNSYQITYGTNPNTGVYCNYTDANLAAVNSGGTSNYTGYYPSSTTYV
jgi:hypothetical protein